MTILEKPKISKDNPASRLAYNRWRYQEYNEAEKARHRKKYRENAARIRKHVKDYLLDHPCIDCGETDPIVLDFDHRVRDEKEFCIGMALAKQCSRETLQKEIDKCDVRCANCHRRKTYREQNHPD